MKFMTSRETQEYQISVCACSCMDANDGTSFSRATIELIMAEQSEKKKLISSLIRGIPDFPQPGILFR